MINKDILIDVSRETRKIYLSKSVIGLDNENLQGDIIFKFIDEFVDGVARLEYTMDEEKNYLMLEKQENQYSIPIRNVLTKEGSIDMQLVITERENDLGIPVFKSNMFYVSVGSSINAVDEAPDGYDLWIEIANAKLLEMNEGLETIAKLEKECDYFQKQLNELQNKLNEYDKYDYLVLESGDK